MSFLESARCSTCNIGRRSIGSAGRSAQCPAFSTQEPHRREWRRSCCRRRARRWACAARACREPHLCPLVVAHSRRRRCRAADGQSRARPILRLLVAVTFHVKQRALGPRRPDERALCTASGPRLGWPRAAGALTEVFHVKRLPHSYADGHCRGGLCSVAAVAAPGGLARRDCAQTCFT